MNKLRLQRRGRASSPYYRFVSISSRSPQSSLTRSILGVYHPMQGSSSAFNLGRTVKYIKLGSQCTPNSLRTLLRQLNYKSEIN